MRQRIVPVGIAMMVLFVLPACGRLSGSGGGHGVDHPTGADRLVLRVDVGGGFVSPSVTLRRIPSFSLFGDGRIITEGPVMEIYPGPALPNVLVRSVTEVGMQAILEAARSAGLFGPDADHPFPCIADAPTTTFTLTAEGRTHVVSAYALGAGQGSCAGVDEAARAKLAGFERKLFDLEGWLPAGSLGPDRAFDPGAMRVFVGPAPAAPDPALEQEPIDWPLATPLSAFGEPATEAPGLACGVVRGPDLRTLVSLAGRANELTPWRSDGRDYSLLFRPLLPDETGC